MRCRRQRPVAAQEEYLGRDPVARERLVPHDEEQAGQHGLRDQVQHHEQRARHGAERQEALREVRYALLYYVRSPDGVVVPLGLARLVRVDLGLGHAQRLGVEGRLGDQTVGEREAEESGHARG